MYLAFIHIGRYDIKARRHLACVQNGITQLGDWRMETWQLALRARCHVSIRQSPSLCNAILNTCPCLLAIKYAGKIVPEWIIFRVFMLTAMMYHSTPGPSFIKYHKYTAMWKLNSHCMVQKRRPFNFHSKGKVYWWHKWSTKKSYIYRKKIPYFFSIDPFVYHPNLISQTK